MIDKLTLGHGVYTRGAFCASLNRRQSPEYMVWTGMLKRCYCPKYLSKSPTYSGCQASENFKNFQYFAEWCNRQIGFGNVGWQLDKDILLRGNRRYDENLCVFIPSKINSVVNSCSVKRGFYPVGVHFDKQTGRYSSQCRIGGVKKNLGRFDTPEEAFATYVRAKKGELLAVAEEYKAMIDSRVYESLIKWEITND